MLLAGELKMSRDDFTLSDLFALLDFIGERSEGEDYEDELNALDLSNVSQARYAIRTWLLPVYLRTWTSSESSRARLKSALRVVLSRWGFLPHGPSLPGIDSGSAPGREPQEIYTLWRQFYRLVWDELFHERFERIADTETLQERNDSAFVNAPSQPERWGAPQYRPLTYWDALLRTDAWRENWPPKEG